MTRIDLKTILLLFTVVFLNVSTFGCGLFVTTLPQGTIPMPTEHDNFIKINGIDYHYLEYKGNRDKVFLLHGFASSTYTWERTAKILADDGYHVYALDMKGFGWSEKPEKANYDAETLAEEVNAWMEEKNLSDMIFVGNSLGGAVAVITALNHPDKVKKLVLIDAVGYPMKKPGMVKLASLPVIRDIVRLFFSRLTIKWTMEDVYYDDDKVTDKGLNAYYDRLRSEGSLDAQAAVAGALKFRNFKKFVEGIPMIKTETLLIWGREDKWIPLRIGMMFKRDIKGSYLCVFNDCGHAPQEEFPVRTAHLISAFIANKPFEIYCDKNE